MTTVIFRMDDQLHFKKYSAIFLSPSSRVILSFVNIFLKFLSHLFHESDDSWIFFFFFGVICWGFLQSYTGRILVSIHTSHRLDFVFLMKIKEISRQGKFLVEIKNKKASESRPSLHHPNA